MSISILKYFCEPLGIMVELKVRNHVMPSGFSLGFLFVWDFLEGVYFGRGLEYICF